MRSSATWVNGQWANITRRTIMAPVQSSSARNRSVTFCCGTNSGACTPYTDGHEDQVIDIKWGEASIYCPPGDWFHQHFNTGKDQARQLAFRYSGQSGKYLLGCWRAINKEGVRTSIRDGGTMVEYEDEDPQIRIDFEAAIGNVAVPTEMPHFEYAEL